MRREFATFFAASGETDLDPRDELEIRRSALGMLALQSMLRSLQWIPSVARVVDTIASLDEEYAPGGPPQSPVHDTLFMTWSCVDMTVERDDTVAALALALAPTLRWSAEVIAAVRMVAESRLGIFRIVDVQPGVVGDGSILVLRELVTEDRISAQLFEEFDLRISELVLARPVVLPAEVARLRGVSHGIFATPYVLHGHSEPEWTDYLERQAAELKVRLDPAVYPLLMRGRGDERRWLEFVVDGYVGQRKHNLVELRGIPDRPETLPQHPDHDPDEALAIPPGASSQERANILSAKVARLFDALASRERDEDREAMAGHFRALQARGADVQLCAELLIPVMLYEGSPAGGRPWIDAMVEEGSLDADVLEYIEAARAAVTSIYEVIDVDAGQSLRLRDVFDGREVVVRERAGSTGAPTRILILARVARYRDIHLLEGMLPHVAPPSLRTPLVARVAQACPVPPPPAPREPGWVYRAMLAWFDVLAEERRGQHPSITTRFADDDTEIDPPSADSRAAVAEGIARRYDAFLDQSIAALDGLSPRMAAEREDLREPLDDLLREHEFAVTRQVGSGVVDFAAFRRELGLEV